MKLKQALALVIELADQNVVSAPFDDPQGAGELALVQESEKQKAAIAVVTSFASKLKSSTSMTDAAEMGTSLDGPYDVSVDPSIVTSAVIKAPKISAVDPATLDKKPSTGPVNKYEAKCVEIAKLVSSYEDKDLTTSAWEAEYNKVRAFFRTTCYQFQKLARLKSKKLPEGKDKVLCYLNELLDVFEKVAKQVTDNDNKAAEAVDQFTAEGIDLTVFKGPNDLPKGKPKIIPHSDGSIEVDLSGVVGPNGELSGDGLAKLTKLFGKQIGKDGGLEPA